MTSLAHCWQRALVVLLMLAVLPALAQEDPPGRVGRIAELQGQVWYYDLEAGDWVAAVRNRPLTTGDRVATDGDGRAEIRIGSSTIRLGAGTEIDLLQIDDEHVRVQLHSGQLALRLRSHEAAREFELVTAEGRFQPDRAGRYRLDRIDATSSATVWSGQLLFQAPDNATTVAAGQRVEIVQSQGRTQTTLLQAQRDVFGDEVAAAEAAAERSVTTSRYVSPEMTGAEALESHGRWVEDVEQGALWVPRAVVPGWAPYRFGRWAFIRPWGWTWIDDAPWGFAPFHFGRWVFWRNAWCWAPGRWVARPVFAPALVAWVGAPLVGVSIHIGPSVGWFPLGPREVFVPAYRVSPRYVRNVNITHVTNITNITQIVNSPNTVVQQTNYIHRGAPHAVTVVPTSIVSGRQPVAPARMQLSDPDVARPGDRRMALSSQAQVTTAPPLAPPTLAAPAVVPPRPRPGIPTRPGPVPPGVATVPPAQPLVTPAGPAPATPVPTLPNRPTMAPRPVPVQPVPVEAAPQPARRPALPPAPAPSQRTQPPMTRPQPQAPALPQALPAQPQALPASPASPKAPQAPQAPQAVVPAPAPMTRPSIAPRPAVPAPAAPAVPPGQAAPGAPGGSAAPGAASPGARPVVWHPRKSSWQEARERDEPVSPRQDRR